MKRNTLIDYLKFTMSIIVMLYHWNMYVLRGNMFPCGYRCVDVFFVISGFFWAKKLSDDNYSFLTTISKRIKSLYPEYIVSFVIITLLYFSTGLFAVFVNENGSIVYIGLLADVFLFTNWVVNLPSFMGWYISSLVLATIIIAYIRGKIKAYNSFIKIILFISLFFSVIIFIFHGDLHVTACRYGVSFGTWRGIIGLSVGITSRYILDKRSKEYKEWSKMIIIFCCIVLFSLQFVLKNTIIDFLVLPISGIICYSSELFPSSKKTIKVAMHLGKLSYIVFLIHGHIREVLIKCYGVTNIIFYVSVVFVAAEIILMIVSFIKRPLAGEIRKQNDYLF